MWLFFVDISKNLKKISQGSFEVDCPIHPVAIKFDARFGDAFWNSSAQSWLEYMLMMMTSWAIVVDVWYMPVMHRQVRTELATPTCVE